MLTCPHDGAKLYQTRSRKGIFWNCPSCAGRLIGMGPMRQIIATPACNYIWRMAKDGGTSHKRKCPSCAHLMAEVPHRQDAHHPMIDVCTRCHLVWFDPDEFEILPQLKEEPQRAEDPVVKQAGALLKVRLQRERVDHTVSHNEYPSEWWKYLPALLGMPVEQGGHELHHAPAGTWVLAAIIATISIAAMMGGLADYVMAYGLIPADAFRLGGITFITSFFLHAGILHLVGNLYFLVIFGDNVEDYLGTARYLGLITAAAIAGVLLHMTGDPRSTVPVVGASAGISGIIAFYALKFPHIRIGLMFRVYFFFHWLQMPTYLAFALWIGLQVLLAFMQVNGYTNVSALGHLGGAIIGVALWFKYRNS